MSNQAGRAPIMTITLIGVLWGLNWPAVKFMLTELPPITIRALAFPIAVLLLLAICLARGEKVWPARRDVAPIILTGLLLIFGFNIMTSLGQTLTETSKAAIIAYTMPALTAFFAAVLLGERLGWRQFGALILGMAGLAVLGSENFAALAREPIGPAFMFLAALFWALGNVALKSRQWSLAPLPLTVWFFVVSTLLSWPLVLWLEPPAQQSWPSTPVLLTLVYHAVGPMVICYALWTILVGRLSATVAAIAALLAPFVGVSSAIVLLGDPVSWQKVAALLLILASIFMSLAPSKPARA